MQLRVHSLPNNGMLVSTENVTVEFRPDGSVNVVHKRKRNPECPDNQNSESSSDAAEPGGGSTSKSYALSGLALTDRDEA